MELKIMFFGRLCDVTGRDNLSLRDINDIKGLREVLHKLYPALASMKYIIAVDKKLVEGDMLLYENNTVALLPPFSGG